MANDEPVSGSNPEVEADGYYGEDDAELEELDLSFLDEEDGDAAAEAKSKPDDTAKPKN